MREAARNAEEALQGHLEVMADHGQALPTPSALDDVPADPTIDIAARVLVRAELPGRSVRMNITMPAELLAAADRYAKRMGFTRSGLLAQAVRERMRRER